MQREIIVDNFAGGGGASTGIERALGVPVDVAVDHNPEALAMHLANQIVDIGMRMLSPRELFRAQGFPDSYVIDPQHNGKSLSKTAQTRCCGNSVCPPVAEAIVRANVVMDESFAVPSRTSRTRRAVGQGMLL